MRESRDKEPGQWATDWCSGNGKLEGMKRAGDREWRTGSTTGTAWRTMRCERETEREKRGKRETYRHKKGRSEKIGIVYGRMDR